MKHVLQFSVVGPEDALRKGAVDPSLEWMELDGDCDLSPLYGIARSPFYGSTPDQVSDLLKECGSRYARLRPDDKRYRALFRQHAVFQSLYVPLSGKIFFTSHIKEKPLERLRLYQEIEVDLLRSSFKYRGAVSRGRPAGLLELMQQVDTQQWKIPNRPDPFPALTHDLLRSGSELSRTSWLHAGFARGGSVILRIPKDSLKHQLTHSKSSLDRLHRRMGGETDGIDRFIRHSRLELASRNSEYLFHASLLSKKDFRMAVVALLLDEARIAGISTFKLTMPEIAWQLGQKDKGTKINHDLSIGDSPEGSIPEGAILRRVPEWEIDVVALQQWLKDELLRERIRSNA